MGHNPDFWRARWRANQIAFHQPNPSALLVENYPLFKPAPKSRVLVPLCGKSKDLVWLVEQGHEVVGVEVAEQAVQAFKEEEGEHENLRLLCADFFALRPKELGTFDWVFDRGALAAIDYETQPKYVLQTLSFLKPSGRVFLIAVEYDETRMSGPPFSVPDGKVRSLYAGAKLIERLADRDCLEQRFVERGLSAMREAAYAITM